MQEEKKKRVGEYLIGETLGKGSFGKVKLAINLRTKEKVIWNELVEWWVMDYDATIT